MCDGNIIQRQELKDIIGRSQSYTDKAIRIAANGEVVDVLEHHHVKVIDIKKGQSTIEKALDIVSNGTE